MLTGIIVLNCASSSAVLGLLGWMDSFQTTSLEQHNNLWSNGHPSRLLIHFIPWQQSWCKRAIMALPGMRIQIYSYWVFEFYEILVQVFLDSTDSLTCFFFNRSITTLDFTISCYSIGSIQDLRCPLDIPFYTPTMDSQTRIKYLGTMSDNVERNVILPSHLNQA